MRRLIDEFGDSDDAFLGRLMRSAGPGADSEISRRRVERGVRARIAARAARGSSLPGWRTAMAAVGLVLIGGFAGATIGRPAWDRLFGAPPAVPAPSSVGDHLSGHPSGHPAAVGAGPSGAALPSTGPAAVAPAEMTPPTTSPTTSPTSPPTAPALAPVAGTARPATDETQPITRRIPAALHATATPSGEAPTARLTALSVGEMDRINAVMTRAQRVLHTDPAFARVAAEDYLRKAPGGMLVEDAMYVACEAAYREHDADAAQLAQHYLRAFPSGQYVARVQARLEKSDPR